MRGFPFARRGDFVIGMSLAEVVVLLLFTAFVFNVLQSEEGGGQDPSLDVATLRAENSALRRELDELHLTLSEVRKDLAEAGDLIEELRKMVGAEKPDRWEMKRRIMALKRGWPPCREDNFLVDATVRDLKMELAFAFVDDDLRGFLKQKGLHVNPGDAVRSESEINLLLAALWAYESQTGRECRFDYRLRYVSPHDYHLGRERLEKVLYPGKLIRIGE
jgi:hypothetical protein